MSDARRQPRPVAIRRPIADADPLLGNWRLAGFAIAHDGGIEHPLGRAPSGSLCYDSDGRMAVHLCKGPDAGAATMMPDYTAYCGRYTLDPVAGTVVHHIEAGSLPQLAGTDQTRRFQLDGDRLLLSADGAQGETMLEWQRSGDGDACADAPRPGFVALETPGVFPGRAGRYYVRDRDGPCPTVATRIRLDQSNSEGFAHGGFLLTFADFATTIIVRGITLNLSADFLRPARIGDWIEARIVTRKRSAELIFADAVATCDGRDILRVSGLFKRFEKNL